MISPKCKVFAPSCRYKQIVIRSVRYDCETLSIEAQGEGFVFARVVFHRPAGFRVLDERDLCEFWQDYHTGNGWLYEVERGGWQDLEAMRPEFLAPQMYPDLQEYLIVCDTCVSVLTSRRRPPEIIDLGADPDQPKRSTA